MKDIISEVRDQFLEINAKNANLFDTLDVERVRSNEFAVKRFVLWNNYDLNKSVKQLVEAMKWRKDNGINGLTAQDIPREFFLAGALYKAGKSKDGLSVVYFRAKTVLKIKKLEPMIQLMTTYMMNTLDTELNGKGAMIVADMSGLTMKNSNLSLLQFVIDLFRKYYPMSVQSMIVYNNPWYLRVFEPVVKGWLSESEQQLLRFASGDELFDYIDKSDVRKYLFGETDDQFVDLPEKCRPLEELANNYGINDKEVKKYLSQYQSIIEEGKQLLNFP